LRKKKKVTTHTHSDENLTSLQGSNRVCSIGAFSQRKWIEKKVGKKKRENGDVHQVGDAFRGRWLYKKTMRFPAHECITKRKEK